MRQERQAGFTLVELLIVVAVIGILAAAIIPGLAEKMNEVKYSAAARDIRILLEHWQGITPQLLSAGEFVRTGEPLEVLTTFPHVVAAQELEDLLEVEVPERDPWGNLYEYRVDAFPSRCLLIRTRGGDGAWDGDIYVTGTLIPVNNRRADLVAIDQRWIVRWDPIWRGIVPIIPIPQPPVPPRILPIMS